VLAAAGLTVAAVVGTWGIGVAGAGAELVTDYPSMSLRPGDTASFELRALSPQRERLDLAVADSPPGWATRILGEGREVAAVISDPDPEETPTIDVETDVPVDARPGVYDVVITATGPSGASTLPLAITVTELASAPFELSAEFPELSGAPDQTFSFAVEVANNTGRDATFAIEASGPTGWDVSARPTAQSQAATLTVAGGETGSLTVSASPAPDTTEGRYPIDVTITADGVPVEGQFTAIVVGTPELVFSAAEERLSLSGEAGSTSTFSVQVANQGTAPLTDVSLSSTAPTDWEVEFEPATVASVAPGEAVPVTARIRPQGDAVAGDYGLTLSAAAEGDRQELAVRFEVETSTWWGFVAIAIIVLALVGLGLVFRRFGRR
jgi:uncharacterized membrane protein